MNKIKNNIIKVLFSILLFTSFTSCDEGGEPDPGATTTVAYAGDWYIDIKDSDGASLASHVHHYSYNTSANDNTMWIDDQGDGYQIKCKVTVDIASGTFSAVNSPNLLDLDSVTGLPASTVTITEGKIIKGGATSKGGHTVDKISFRAHFSYDTAGYDILYEGHKRTGFLEDEY
jgi:Lipid-binding putative hydrolase